MTEEYLTTGQAAERLRGSTKMVIGLLASGKLSARRIGVRWQIPVAAVRAYSKAAPVTFR
jgi:excisionase family DNA binding protein